MNSVEKKQTLAAAKKMWDKLNKKLGSDSGALKYKHWAFHVILHEEKKPSVQLVRGFHDSDNTRNSWSSSQKASDDFKLTEHRGKTCDFTFLDAERKAEEFGGETVYNMPKRLLKKLRMPSSRSHGAGFVVLVPAKWFGGKANDKDMHMGCLADDYTHCVKHFHYDCNCKFDFRRGLSDEEFLM
jgi:hypothetical protein